MAMDPGDEACTHGLSKRIYTYLTTDANAGFSASLTTAQTNAIKALCRSIAQAVYDEITINAVPDCGGVNGTIT